MKRLVDTANTPRNKAFIITLYESGARIGELGNMQIRDVVFEDRYTTLMLQGKTTPPRYRSRCYAVSKYMDPAPPITRESGIPVVGESRHGKSQPGNELSCAGESPESYSETC